MVTDPLANSHTPQKKILRGEEEELKQATHQGTPPQAEKYQISNESATKELGFATRHDS